MPASPQLALLMHCTHVPAESHTRPLVHCESMVQAAQRWLEVQRVLPPPVQLVSAMHSTQALVVVSHTGVGAAHIPLSVQGTPAVPPELLDESAPPSLLPEDDPDPPEEPEEPDEEPEAPEDPDDDERVPS